MNREGLKVQVPTLVKLTRSRVRCPGCGEEVDAVASDGRVRGYCAVSRQRVDFLAETQRPETAEISASGPDPDEVKDGVVRDYLAGDQISVIQLRYGVSPGTLYRVLHDSHVRLRTSQEAKQNRCRATRK